MMRSDSQRSNRLATAALVLGLYAVLAPFLILPLTALQFARVGAVLFLLSPLAGVAAIICGHLARSSSRRAPGSPPPGVALAGLVLGYVFVGMAVLVGGVTAVFAPRMIAAFKAAQGAGAAANPLHAIGAPFPAISETAVDGRVISTEALKGKVVLVDFWAMWCGPCIAELPNVVAAYDKHHAAGFEIVGISLDQGGDREKLIEFTQKRRMPWPQYFDGKFWQTKLAVEHGIHSIPATVLIDREGNIIARNLRGAELEKAVAAALASKPL